MCEKTIPLFQPTDCLSKRPRGAVPAGRPAGFFVRPGRGYAAKSARLLIRAEGEEAAEYEMEYRGVQNLCDVFALDYTPENPGLFWYHFELETAFGREYLCPANDGKGMLTGRGGEDWQLTVCDPAYTTPDWIKGGIIYQIFPDRFCRVGPAPQEIPAGRILRGDWGGTPAYRPDAEGKVRNDDYFGGNLQGILAKLPYLQSLGVTALYLNPIFESHSNHRYDTADYMKVDPLLGSEEDFRELCAAAAALGIRVILDGVFNHTGDDSIYFNRYGRYPGPGAYQSKDSPYYSWYRFNKWPDDYDCWWNILTLPDVNEDEPSFSAFITGPQGVLAHWLHAGAAGYRLDVADELPEDFIRKIRQAVKTADPQALLIGEIWEDASNKVSYGERRHYLQGGEFDGVMNYPFRSAILRFLRGGKAKEINETVLSVLDHYPKASVDVMMNLLGTHDTLRALTALAGESSDGRSKDWMAAHTLTAEQRRKGERLLCLASAMQFLLPGVPSVYYGDEAGMEGYADPFNRRCFPWGGEEQTLLSWYRRLGNLRRSCPALSSGEYECLEAAESLYVFARTKGEDRVVCAVNAGGRAGRFTFPSESEKYTLQLSSPDGAAQSPGACPDIPMEELPPLSCRIYGAGPWTDAVKNPTAG